MFSNNIIVAFTVALAAFGSASPIEKASPSSPLRHHPMLTEFRELFRFLQILEVSASLQLLLQNRFRKCSPKLYRIKINIIPASLMMLGATQMQRVLLQMSSIR